jgi:hypothetical protein
VKKPENYLFTYYLSLFIFNNSGGGFSNVFAMPVYQTSVVQNYIANSLQKVPSTWYNAKGRAYPGKYFLMLFRLTLLFSFVGICLVFFIFFYRRFTFVFTKNKKKRCCCLWQKFLGCNWWRPYTCRRNKVFINIYLYLLLSFF